MNVSSASAAMLPWFSPAYYGLLGHSPREPALVVAYEWPIPWIATVEDLPKVQRELLCLKALQRRPAVGCRDSRFRGSGVPEVAGPGRPGRIKQQSTGGRVI